MIASHVPAGFRQAERSYNNKLISDLEISTYKKPNEFWNKIRSLGPRKQTLSASVYHSGSNEPTNDTEYVREKWKN